MHFTSLGLGVMASSSVSDDNEFALVLVRPLVQAAEESYDSQYTPDRVRTRIFTSRDSVNNLLKTRITTVNFCSQ